MTAPMAGLPPELLEIEMNVQPSLWPLAWGWWVLIVVFLVFTILILRGLHKFYLNRAVKRAALRELRLLNTQTSVNELNQLLKKILLAECKQPHLASIYGQEWYQFLCSLLSPKQQLKLANPVKTIAITRYDQPARSITPDDIATVKQYLKMALPIKTSLLHKMEQSHV